MIVSTGIDLVEVARIARAIERTPRFRERVFTFAETAYCEARAASRWTHYAARFAAKEAAFKALGTGWSGGVAWHDAEVRRDEHGAPSLVLTNRARELFDSRGATRSHLSLSHTSEYAVAYVIFEKV